MVLGRSTKESFFMEKYSPENRLENCWKYFWEGKFGIDILKMNAKVDVPAAHILVYPDFSGLHRRGTVVWTGQDADADTSGPSGGRDRKKWP